LFKNVLLGVIFFPFHQKNIFRVLSWNYFNQYNTFMTDKDIYFKVIDKSLK